VPASYAPAAPAGSAGDRRAEVDALFDAALDRTRAERSAWLAGACGDDPWLRDEVAALLAAHDRAEGLLDGDPGRLVTPARPGPGASAAPDRVGPWRLVEEIGRGGMGTVYRAERDDGQFGQTAAVKLLTRGPDNADLVRRFVAERQILATLAHPNVARLLDGGAAADGRPYLVMEYVDGQPVTAHCDAGRLDVDARLRLFATTCRAVAHAHAHLVVHRDLKPANIFVDRSGAVKLLDFGIAKLLGGPPPGAAPGDGGPDAAPVPNAETRAGQHPMTPAYASPEQVRGAPATTATDVYGLGLVLYELLCGRPAQRPAGGSYDEVARAVLTDEPARPSAAPAGAAGDAPDQAAVAAARGTTPARLARRLRGDLDAVVLHALAKDPARRYASAEALALDVERHLAGLPVQAGGAAPAYRVGKFVRRHRWGVAASAGFVVLLAGYAATATLQAGRERRALASERAALARARAEAAKSEQVTRFMMAMFAAGDPGEARGETVTAREILRRGAEQADRLGAEPVAQAQLLDVVGRVHASLGEYGRAQPLLERALDLRRRALGDAHPDVARSRSHLGALLTARGDFAGAEGELRRALAGARPGAERAADLVRLGAVRIERGDLDDAAALLGRALAEGAPDSTAAAALDQLAFVDSRRGDLAGAERRYRDALARRRRLFGDDHPDVAQALNNVAAVLAQRGRASEAAAAYADVLARRRRLLGGDHPDVAVTLTNLAVVTAEQGDVAGAVPRYREVLALRRRQLGDAHPQTLRAAQNLGVALARSGDAAAGVPLVAAAVARRRLRAADDPRSWPRRSATTARRSRRPATTRRPPRRSPRPARRSARRPARRPARR
jgi:serine/threonine-protein kinase